MPQFLNTGDELCVRKVAFEVRVNLLNWLLCYNSFGRISVTSQLRASVLTWAIEVFSGYCWSAGGVTGCNNVNNCLT